MADGAYLYILRCSDGSYYIGTTRSAIEIRLAQHNEGTFRGYTSSRRPVTLIFSEWFERVTDAIECERKLKGWSRAKKEAFMHGDFVEVRKLAERKSRHPSRRRLRRALRMRAEPVAQEYRKVQRAQPPRSLILRSLRSKRLEGWGGHDPVGQ